MRHEEKEKIALWRLGVLGPLISARLEHGDRRRYIDDAAARLQQQPDGTYVQLSARTIESWYYAYRHGGILHRSTVHRLLRAHQLSYRPQRYGGTERRSFLPEHAGDLWVGDALHGPLVIAPDGSLRKAYLLSQIDGATRFVPHSYFALSESAADQEYGFQQAVLKHGLPRAYYVDLGAAYIADSLKLICAELGIRLLHTQVQDCEAKGVIERWHRT
jgi:transposase InsO family protein